MSDIANNIEGIVFNGYLTELNRSVLKGYQVTILNRGFYIR